LALNSRELAGALISTHEIGRRRNWLVKLITRAFCLAICIIVVVIVLVVVVVVIIYFLINLLIN